jgi:N-acetylglutamate synthase-like GNAT family acetyltransferase
MGQSSAACSKRVYPALHLEYVAVDKSCQHQDIGTDIMVRVLETFRRAVLELGVPVLTLVPLTQKLVDFYAELGFHRYAVHLGVRRMMLPAQTVLDMAAKAEAALAEQNAPAQSGSSKTAE